MVEREGAETISAGIEFLCDTGTKELKKKAISKCKGLMQCKGWACI